MTSATTLIKRRLTGAAGAPTALDNGQLAYNEVDDILYYGKGQGGDLVSAASIIPIAGSGHYATLTPASTTTAGLATYQDNLTGAGVVNKALTANQGYILAQALGALGTASTLASSAVALVANNLSDLAAPSTALANLGVGVPSAESAGRALVAADNQKTLTSTGTNTFTVNTGMPSGFGVLAITVSGAVTFTAGSGVTITDARTTGNTAPMFATLVQSAANTYYVIGGKA